MGVTSNGIENVRQYVAENGINATITILEPESTRTSALAAESLGCTIAEIAKSIGFVIRDKNQPIMVVLSGDRRVSVERLSHSLGLEVSSFRKMTADEVKQLTGYSIGGVPPFPHQESIKVIVDESLFRFEKVWAAAGSSNAVMSLEPRILVEKIGLERVNVAD
jgi:prolyl-tRNA editing enzyme YbaK/EbsC (Cys-tRNA(Pro) deacylase)